MLDMLLKRRTIRKFQDKPVERELLDKILLGALTSPSSRNRKQWKLIVVEDTEDLKKLGITRGEFSAPIARAPVAIVVAVNAKNNIVWVEDCSIVATVIQLMAQSLGLGSCWVQIRNRITLKEEIAEDYVKKILNLPEEYNVECIIPLGYPAEEKASHNKENLPYEKIHYGKF